MFGQLIIFATALREVIVFYFKPLPFKLTKWDRKHCEVGQKTYVFVPRFLLKY